MPLAGRPATPHPKMLPSGRIERAGGTAADSPPPQLVAVGRSGEGRGASVRHPHPKMLPSGASGLTEQQMQRFRRDFPGSRLPWLEREFRDWVAEREAPQDYSAAFYGFMKRKKAEM